MINKNYYQEKQQKLQQKVIRIKDQFIVDSLNMVQRLANELQEIQAENQEISDILQKQIEEEKKEDIGNKGKEEETKTPIKKGK